MKFGTFKGVFVPSTEAILGTVLFLLLPVLTADLGLIKMLLIVVLAHTVTFSTMFSIADIATNLNTIGGGGMYALIKRSLGKAMGGSIGIQLFLAQAASIGFYSIGFAEPLHPFLMPFLKNIPFLSGTGAEGILFQKQILSSIVFLIFFTVVMFGADFTLKVQTLILYIL
ncbi:MAG: amino acid permease, partial [Candidatus Delongbacteria bacterium]|nr:amino acid permease [Candidatus Delongbacteria bacterium]